MNLVFRATAISNLLTAGADARAPDVRREALRVPELRGQLRFWFRAQMGAIVGQGDLQELAQLETDIFGGPDRRSAVRVRAVPLRDLGSEPTFLRMEDRSPITTKQGKQIVPKRPGIPAGTGFTVFFRTTRSAVLAPVTATVWLVSMFSGVGARTRRGFGSLEFIPDAGMGGAAISDTIDFRVPAADLPRTAAWLTAGLQQVRTVFATFAGISEAAADSRFSVLSGETMDLRLLEPRNGKWMDWRDVMRDLRRDVYKAYKSDRIYKPRSFRSLGHGGERRLASPLVLQIKRRQDHSLFGVLAAFRNQTFFGNDWEYWRAFLDGLPPRYQVVPVDVPLPGSPTGTV